MIATVGLLTPPGLDWLDYFYAVLEDFASMADVNRDLTLFLDPQVLPYDGEQGKAKRECAPKQYNRDGGLHQQNAYTRHKYQDGTTEIKIKAIDVWDTVGTLGIPPVPVIGLRGALLSVGVEFNPGRMEDIFNQGLRYSAGHLFSDVAQGPWNGKDSYPAGSEEDPRKLARPWALGLMQDPGGRLQTIGGTTVRHPGIFMRTDPDTNEDSDEALLNTNERIHSSVRDRLACQGLALDDPEIWDCKPLTWAADGIALWKLERGSGLTASKLNQTKSFRPRELDLGMGDFDGKLYPVGDRDGQWRWVLVDKRRGAVSLEKVLPEEPVTGYWEQYLLALTAGKPDVWRWAEENPPLDAAGSKA